VVPSRHNCLIRFPFAAGQDKLRWPALGHKPTISEVCAMSPADGKNLPFFRGGFLQHSKFEYFDLRIGKPEVAVGVGHVRSTPNANVKMPETFRHILTEQPEASILAVSSQMELS
jgi:hypothetical protein